MDHGEFMYLQLKELPAASRSEELSDCHRHALLHLYSSHTNILFFGQGNGGNNSILGGHARNEGDSDSLLTPLVALVHMLLRTPSSMEKLSRMKQPMMKAFPMKLPPPNR